MSYASNLGFGKYPPNHFVNNHYVNKEGSNLALYTDNSTGLNASAGHGIFYNGKGGRRRKQRRYKKNNNTTIYMKTKRHKYYKRKNNCGCKSRHRRHRRHHRTRSYKGGTYHQYMSNVPYTPNYSVGGPLAPQDSALANPPPIKMINTCQNCYK